MEKKKVNLLVIFLIIIVTMLSVASIVLLKISNRKDEIKTENLVIKREIAEKINNSEIETLLHDYLIEEINLFNSNEKNTTIEQTKNAEEMENKIEKLIDYENKSLGMNTIYFDFTNISGTTILAKPVSVEGDRMQADLYNSYMSEIKNAIENVINEYCIYETKEEKEERIQEENNDIALFKIEQGNNSFFINEYGYIKDKENSNSSYVLNLSGINVETYQKYVEKDLFNNLKIVYSALHDNNIVASEVSINKDEDDEIEVNFISRNKTLIIKKFDDFLKNFNVALQVMDIEENKKGEIIIDENGKIFFRDLSEIN